MTNASTAHGREPFDTVVWMRAVEAGDAPTVKALLDAGADVNAVAEAGETALMRAASKGHLEVVRLLLDAGGEVHARSENGFTPLFMAVFFGHEEVVRALLARGSDPSAPVRPDMNAEKWARLWGSAEIVKLLNDASARAQEPAAEDPAGSAQEDARPPLFPADGQFRSVVPLSEIDGMRAASAGEPPLESADAEVMLAAKDGRDDRQDEGRDEGQDETTLVAARVNQATPPRRSPAFRAKGVRRSWPVTAIALVLSVLAGLFAGTYLIRSGQPAETPRPASQTDDSSAPVKTEPVADSDTHATVADASESKEEVASADESPSKFAPRTTPPATRRASADETPDRSGMNASARTERPERPAEAAKNISPAPRFARRDTAQAHATRVSKEPSSRPAPPEHSLPISSPPPSVKSRKVIQWP